MTEITIHVHALDFQSQQNDLYLSRGYLYLQIYVNI